MPSQQNITLRAKGLYTFPNALSEVPDGALSEASNVVIDRDGVINPRRGFKLYGDDFGTSSDRSKQLLLYKGRILRHWLTTLDVDSNGTGTFTVMNDADNVPISVSEPVAGTRIKYVEANGNLFFTTSAGIRKISCLDVADLATRPVTPAGGVKALDGIATLNSLTGWFSQDSVVAYRVVWGIRDDNTNVILGSPSERIVIQNPLLTLLINNYNQTISDLAVVAAVPAVVLTGDTTNTSTTILNVTTTNLSVGMTITGSGIPASTTITGIPTSTSITISNAATATATGVSLTFDEKLKDTDYASLKISVNSSAPTLYASLKALANGASNKLDNDIGGTTFQSIALTPATTPGNPATTGELEDMQEYFDNVVNDLNTTTGISTYAKTFIGGAFQNSTQSATTNVIFTIPQEITIAHFYQVYRSALFQSVGSSTLGDITPDDELRLVFESNPTAAEISAESVNFYDNVPETFRQGGANLYTNANSGEGIAQANEVPPLARDIALFKNSTFYANTQTKYKKQLGLLTAVGLAGGTFTISQGSTYNTYLFTASVAQVTNVTCVSGANLINSGTSDYFDIYSADSTNHYRIWFQVGTSVAPSAGGATLVQCTVLNPDTNAEVATKLQYVITSISDFRATVSTNVVTVTNEDSGYTTAPSENVANVGFAISVTTTGTGENAAQKRVAVSNADTPAQQVDETARSLVRVVNKNSSEVVYAYYVSGTDDLPGLMLFEARHLGDARFYLSTNTNTISEKFSPDLRVVKTITAISAANPTHITCTSHGLTSGQTIIISGSNSTPSIDGPRVVTVLDSDNFTIPVNVTVLGTTGGFLLQSAAISADNEVVPNRIYYSKEQQPEAVPIVNYQDVGPKNKKILRILPLRDSLFILSESGVYRLSGDGVFNFQITLFDSSTQVKAADSAVVLNNQIYMFSSQGIATISDTGVSVVSRPIENNLLPLVTSLYSTFSDATFAVAYESDRSYLLFTVSSTTDTVATICYRFNTFTNTWVSWDIEKTCGVINTEQDKLYLGAGDTNYIEVERKVFSRLDHADRETEITIPVDGIVDDTLSLGSLFDTEVGDVFVQTQYLTVAQYNRLLRRLDTDSGLNDHDYYSTLNVSAGVNLRQYVSDLATKLDADSGLATHTYVASISGFGPTFEDTQDAFNTIVTLLIADANTKVKTYSQSTNTVQYEAPVLSVDTNDLSITLSYNAPYIAGPVVQYKKIASKVTWIPHHFGDVSTVKHVSESTLLFESMDFTKATASYSSDLSPGFESVDITGEGTGIWGGFSWGQVLWGGVGSGRPFRTFIPANKQRCRYINGRFQHSSAFEKYAIYGISFTYSPISSRGYK